MDYFNIRIIIDYIIFKFMSGVRETFNYEWSNTLVEQELKELESRATENSINEFITIEQQFAQEVLNHTFDNTLVVDGIRAKGF